MQQPKIEVNEQGVLSITTNINVKGTLSRSGKSFVLASTKGNIRYELPDGRVIYIGLNVYQRA